MKECSNSGGGASISAQSCNFCAFCWSLSESVSQFGCDIICGPESNVVVISAAQTNKEAHKMSIYMYTTQERNQGGMEKNEERKKSKLK